MKTLGVLQPRARASVFPILAPHMAWAEDELHDAVAGASSKLFEQQLRNYERDKLACRLKVCCMLQLVRRRPA